MKKMLIVLTALVLAPLFAAAQDSTPKPGIYVFSEHFDMDLPTEEADDQSATVYGVVVELKLTQGNQFELIPISTGPGADYFTDRALGLVDSAGNWQMMITMVEEDLIWTSVYHGTARHEGFIQGTTTFSDGTGTSTRGVWSLTPVGDINLNR